LVTEHAKINKSCSVRQLKEKKKRK